MANPDNTRSDNFLPYPSFRSFYCGVRTYPRFLAAYSAHIYPLHRRSDWVNQGMTL